MLSFTGHIVSVEKQSSGPWWRLTIDKGPRLDGRRFERVYSRDPSAWDNVDRSTLLFFDCDLERHEVRWCGTRDQTVEHFGLGEVPMWFWEPYVIDRPAEDPDWPGVRQVSKQGGCVLPIIGLIAVMVSLGTGLVC